MKGSSREPKHKLKRKDFEEGTLNSMLHAIHVIDDKTPPTKEKKDKSR